MRGLGQRFTKLWIATTVSAAGDGLLVTGLPLLAREVTDSPVMLSAVFAAGRVPWVFGLVTGSMVDRRDARRVLIWSDVVRGLVLGGLAFRLLATGSLPTIAELVGLAFVLGIGAVVFFGAAQRAVPALVTSTQLDQANGYLESTNILGEQFVGPAIGGMVNTAGKLPIIGDAVSFIVSAYFLRALPSLPGHADDMALTQQVAVGWKWFVGHPAIRSLTLATSTVAALSTFVLATEVVIVQDTLGLAPYWLAPFTAAMATGGVIGGLVAPRVIARFGSLTFTIAVLASGLCYGACIGSRSVPLLMIALALQTLTVIVANVSAVSIRQRAVPPEIRARVIGLARSIIFGAQIPGALLGGLIAENWGTDTMFTFAAVGTIVTALVTARPLRRLLAPYQAPLQTAKAA